MRVHHTVFAIAVLGCIVSAGCGPSNPETIPVSGVVTLDGDPVAGAAVVFTPEEGQPATGSTDELGRFELSTFQKGDGALPGTHSVTVSKTTVEPGDEETVEYIIPRKYGNRATSELTCDVHPEMEPVRFDLKSEPVVQAVPEPEIATHEVTTPAEEVREAPTGPNMGDAAGEP